MTPESIRARLHTRVVGKRILCVELCASTNDVAWQAALDGAPDGTAVFAEEQTQGRGRLGRTWTSPRGTNLLVSIVLRPRLEIERVPLITALGALAVTDAVDLPARVRFPNDIVVDGRKLAGILVESRFISERPDLFILGIGLNVNAHPPDLPATSLAQEKGREQSRTIVARALLEAVDEWYARLDGPLKPWQKAWRERSDLLGREVRIRERGRSTAGTVDDMDPIEGIVLRLASGHVRSFRGEHVEHVVLR